jgi:hypothetical protein
MGSENDKSGENCARSENAVMTDLARTGAELEIEGIVEEVLAKWRAAQQQADPYSAVTVAHEFDMRRCITELERAKRGLPLITRENQRPSSVVWEVRTYEEIQRSPAKKPPWKIEGLVVENAATLVSAHPHSVKSLSWLQATLEAVTTHRVWGHFDASGVECALFIEVEDPVWLVEARVRGIAQGLGLRPDQEIPGFHVACSTPFNLVAEAQTLRDLLRKYEPDFAVLSTLQSFLGGRDWNQQDEMQPVNALILELTRICPLVVLTHSPWNTKERRAAGTVTQTANYLTTMHYQKIISPSDRRTVIHVVLDSKAGSSVGDFHLALQTEGDENDPSSALHLVYGGEGRPRGAGKEAVLEALDDNPDASAEEIAERVGVTARYVRKIEAERGKKSRRRSRKGQSGSPDSAASTPETLIDPNDPRLTSENP